MATKNVVVLTVLLSAFCVVMASAQVPKTPPTPQAKAEKMTEHMKKMLKLSDEQATKMEALNVKFIEAQEQMGKAIREARQDFKAKMVSHKADLQKILTPEQLKQLQSCNQHMRHMRMTHKMGMWGMRGGMNGMRNHHAMKSDTTQTTK
jgi:Spy/CpxP family protein refolding chaperone